MDHYSPPRHNSDPFNEKSHSYQEPTSPSRAYIPTQRDPEKAESHRSHSSGSPCSDRLSAVRVWENMPASENRQEELAKTLIHLSTSNPLIAFIFSLYCLVVMFVTFTVGFIRRIGKDGISFQDQLIRALAPVIRYELRFINTEVNLYESGPLSAGRLIGVLALSPLFSIGVMLAAWTAATFWMYTTILGEPNQKQGKEVDGKSAARWVKGLWERWLLLGL